MTSRQMRRSPITFMAAAALIISVWGVVAQDGAGAAAGEIAVYGNPSDCPPRAKTCLYLRANSVGASEIKSNAVGALEIIKNAIHSSEVNNGAIVAKDVGTLGLRNVKGIYPSAVGTAATSLENASNHYFGSAGQPNPVSSFHNFDTLVTQGAQWSPCFTDPSVPPAFPCLKVPVTGTYQVTVKGIWEENDVGGRAIGLFSDPACDVAAGNNVVRSFSPASSLPTNFSEGGRLQIASAMVALDKGECLIGHAWNNDSGSTLDLEYEVALALQ